jgi:hypothetical protein
MSRGNFDDILKAYSSHCRIRLLAPLIKSPSYFFPDVTSGKYRGISFFFKNPPFVISPFIKGRLWGI